MKYYKITVINNDRQICSMSTLGTSKTSFKYLVITPVVLGNSTAPKSSSDKKNGRDSVGLVFFYVLCDYLNIYYKEEYVFTIDKK